MQLIANNSQWEGPDDFLHDVDNSLAWLSLKSELLGNSMSWEEEILKAKKILDSDLDGVLMHDYWDIHHDTQEALREVWNDIELKPSKLKMMVIYLKVLDLDLKRDKVEVKVLPPNRTNLLNRLLDYIQKGSRIFKATVKSIQEYVKNLLGVGTVKLNNTQAALSEKLWKMLEQGRGNRVVLVMQNLIGYFVYRGWLPKGSPALCRAFFGTEEGYPNIDKGNPNSTHISESFRSILPLLDSIQL